MKVKLLGCVATLTLAPAVLAQAAPDPLAEGFREPPPEARPHVWWHWMNGNITKEGIAKDIAWMQRIGIGGVQNFDAALMTPQVVDKRLVYMTPEWKDAFRFAAEKADEAGLELAIASSPGWSETGGPWVAPQDGMKKLAWSETVMTGGKALSARIAAPPRTTGPYQSMAAEGALGLARVGAAAPEAYGDVAVLAVPLLGPPRTVQATLRDGKGKSLDSSSLSDGNPMTTMVVPSVDGAEPMLLIDYSRPFTIRSATIALKNAGVSYRDPAFTPRLEAKTTAGWRRIATFDAGSVPTTIAFAPTRAQSFRLVFGKFEGKGRPALASPQPGVLIPPFLVGSDKPSPAEISHFSLSQEPRVDHAEAKAGFSIVNDYAALETTASLKDQGPRATQVVDLTSKLREDGFIDWRPPKGQWRIFRLGWTLTGHTNHPAPAEATGLEVDKLDAAAVTRYLEHYLATYRDAAGADRVGARGVRALLTDSSEVGAFNWTPRIVEQFRRLRGYDPVPWLPVLTGMLIGTRADSDRFLYDLRRTISDLHATEHYGTIATIARRNGLTLYGEALEDQRPVLGDDMAMRRYADIPMAALWTWNDANGPRPTLLGDMKGASSVGHVYGKNIVAAESMTSALAPWAFAPADLRRVIDLEFVNGINRPVIHTSVHQPEEKAPGLSLSFFGQFFNRHESWAEMAKSWIDYIARSSFLLQQGWNVADVAYFYGEDTPITAQTTHGPMPGTPTRYAFDYVDAGAVLDTLTVADGDLVAASGARYRVLYLGNGAKRLTLAMLKRLGQLVSEGATMVGEAPTGSPSLADDPTAYAALAKQLWAGGAATRFGKGRVIATRDIEAALNGIGVAPDIDTGVAALPFVHRRLADGDLYFLVNRGKTALSLDVRFRVAGKQPEIWHADTGRSELLSYQQDAGGTVVPMSLAAEESAFVLFRDPATAVSRTITSSAAKPLPFSIGTWTVAFQPGRGAPARTTLSTLAPLSTQADPAIRYFSGEARYTTMLTLPRDVQSQGKLWLDLGNVRDVAEVTLNGQVLGTAWHAPYRIEIARAAKPGRNRLEVRVANTWINRLIGDAQPGARKVAFTTIPTYRADAPLRPSGLIGPLTVISAGARPLARP